MLVVEDEPLVGLDVVDTLRAAGADAVSARSEGQAIALLDRLQILSFPQDDIKDVEQVKNSALQIVALIYKHPV